MEAILIGIGVTVSLTTIIYWWRRDKLKELEERQLQMFMDSLIWDTDEKMYIVEDRLEIKPLPAVKDKIV